MQVRRIDPGRRRDVRRFLRVPFDLYRHSEQWVPLPLSVAAEDLDRRRHAFYEHSDAAFFLADDGGDTVGRLMVFDHRPYNEHHDRRDAFFGLFDSTEDPAAASALFAAAEAWARGRGLRRMIGPRGLLASDGMGVLVEGFEHRAAMSANYNHPYYDGLILSSGFVKETDFVSGRLVRGDRLPQQFFAMAEAAREHLGVEVDVATSRREVRGREHAIGDAYNEAFAANWEFAPVTRRELNTIADRLLPTRGSAFIATLRAGEEVAGFMFILVDITAALQRVRGRTFPFAWVSLLRAYRRSRLADVNGLGLRPSYRGAGAMAVLFAELVRLSEEHSRFEAAEVLQIEENLTPMLDALKAVGVPFHKRHRLYRKDLP